MSRRRRDQAGKVARLRGPVRGPQPTGKPPYCSFCGRGCDEYDNLVQGPQAYICNLCLDASARLVADDEA